MTRGGGLSMPSWMGVPVLKSIWDYDPGGTDEDRYRAAAVAAGRADLVDAYTAAKAQCAEALHALEIVANEAALVLARRELEARGFIRWKRIDTLREGGVAELWATLAHDPRFVNVNQIAVERGRYMVRGSGAGTSVSCRDFDGIRDSLKAEVYPPCNARHEVPE